MRRKQILQQREILKKASQIRERAYDAYQKLYSRSGSVIGELSEIKKSMEFLASANPGLDKLQENFEEALYRLEDVALELRAVSEKSHADPAKLEQLEERLATIRRLKKKYGKDLPGLIALLETLAKEAGDIIDARSLQKNRSAAAEQCRVQLRGLLPQTLCSPRRRGSTAGKLDEKGAGRTRHARGSVQNRHSRVA